MGFIMGHVNGNERAPEVDTQASRWTRDAVFNAAWAYNLAFAWDPSRETEVTLALAQVTAGARILLPACGTGRHAHKLAELGFYVDASDINDEMLAIARAERPHANIRYSAADMTKPLLGGEICDAAMTFTNSFRYILEDKDIDFHFKAVHARLRPGAAYIIDLGLTHGDEVPGGKAQWTVRYEDCVVRASWTLLRVDPPIAVELARILVEGSGETREVVAEQPQRIWSYAGLALAAANAGFTSRGACNLDGTPCPEPTKSSRYYVVLVRQ